MNYGNGGIILQSHTAGGGMPGPPFAPTSADNGLSVDPVSGKIVLGNDAGGSSAMLLSAREIPNNGFNITVKDAKSTFGLGFGSSNFTNGVPEVFNGYSADSDVNGFFNQNSSPGTHAVALYGTYNNVSTNYLFGVTGSNYTGGFTGLATFPPDSAFIQTIDNSSSSKLFISAQGGIFFEGDQKLQTVNPTMKLVSGHLMIKPGGVTATADQGFALQVYGEQLIEENTAFVNFGTNPTQIISNPNATGVAQILFKSNGNNVGVFAADFGNQLRTVSIGQTLFQVGPFAAPATRMVLNNTGVSINSTGGSVAEALEVTGNIRLSGVMNAGGTPGFTGTVSPVTSITVVGGIVTAVS